MKNKRRVFRELKQKQICYESCLFLGKKKSIIFLYKWIKIT
jgi:hypothetical protein